MTSTAESYRNQFRGSTRARDYDAIQYAPTSYDSLLWDLEKEWLGRYLTQLRQNGGQLDYLDFAAGTGRVLGFVEPFATTATAIEISDSMAAIAQEKVENATVLCKDVTRDDDVVEATYDLITAFRFILNAEPDLRLAALKKLIPRLKKGSGRLVINNHGNPWSVKAVLWPGYALSKNKRRRLAGNLLTHREVLRLVDQLGLAVESTYGYGILGGKVARAVSYGKAGRLERGVAGGFLSRFGVNRIYVLKVPESAGSS